MRRWLPVTRFAEKVQPSRRFRFRLAFLAGLAWLCCLRVASAHPVAQGALEITLRPEALVVLARVSNEEVFIAEAFGGSSGGEWTLAETRQRHGAYLLAHLHFAADGVTLSGEMIRLVAAASAAPDALVGYELRYTLPPGDPYPAVISLEQDVLNEFTFAPGNPWEASYVVRVTQAGHPSREGLLSTRLAPVSISCDWTAPVAPATESKVDWAEMTWAFIQHGFRHIFGGVDHLLFIAGLVLATATLWDLVKVVSVFTLSHSITLTLAVLNIVRVPSRIVEVMIAASIVFVTLQNVLTPERTRSRTRLAAVFGFGLFHGLGFAGGLLRAMEGMSGTAALLAIAAFSFGVELGHQCVGLPLFGAMRAVEAHNRGAAVAEKFPGWLARAASGAISCAGATYLVAALRAV